MGLLANPHTPECTTRTPKPKVSEMPPPGVAPKPPKLKIEGSVVPLEKEFVVNLEEGHYGKVSVALVVKDGAAGGEEGGAEAIVLPQEPVIRAIITDHLTGLTTEDLTDRTRRGTVIEDILESIDEDTDEHVTEVLFTDLAVQ